jgi:hypothetical protein
MMRRVRGVIVRPAVPANLKVSKMRARGQITKDRGKLTKTLPPFILDTRGFYGDESSANARPQSAKRASMDPGYPAREKGQCLPMRTCAREDFRLTSRIQVFE